MLTDVGVGVAVTTAVGVGVGVAVAASGGGGIVVAAIGPDVPLTACILVRSNINTWLPIAPP